LRGIPTHGELSALLLESDLVKELQPMYNRVLRQKERMALVLACETAGGYASIEVVDRREITPEDGERLLAVYSTPTRARQSLHAAAMRYRLCPKLLGLERTNRACFQSQLGKCDRACEGSEPPGAYNDRFAAAFERQRVVEWPYHGPVLIRERTPGLEGATGFVVDRWCLKAQLRELENGEVEASPELHRFDLDRYKIIKRFLENDQNRRAVSVMTPAQATSLVNLHTI